ncbi:hypothetical protein OIHEL45_17561 [Sulfitobacter indolifex HEL-45]|uniref:Uncharacterized protein n=1 Tax=Sulfitobacter indolifex HEL-45 TaxID=391624 RepID=A0ABM9X2W0_9RHOB|nr:hypothetical protein OIHEL45_17561 [Sulfitobacter indolifex HEL-45]
MADDITIGFAIAKSGWLEAYDAPAVAASKPSVSPAVSAKARSIAAARSPLRSRLRSSA